MYQRLASPPRLQIRDLDVEPSRNRLLNVLHRDDFLFIADQIAQHAEFFSFGTNDLTQMTFGYSRDDVAKFLPDYLQKNLLPADPFSVLDQEGVGELIKLGIERGRRTRGSLKVGICGEHGGEPTSVEFCHRVGMTYVSCSPFMIPIARLAAAQARIREREAGSVPRG